MSISSRITEIEQHIGNAYDKIEDLGIDLTDVDKNIDNISSMLEQVWEEYPKVSISDVEEASIDGSKKGRMNIDLKGNTDQEQLSGKNLLFKPAKINETTRNSQTLNGITFEILEGGRYKITGTATALTDFTLYRATYEDLIINSSTCSISATSIPSGLTIILSGTTTNGIPYTQLNSSTLKAENLSITDQTQPISYLLFRVASGATINTIIELQLETGSTATSFERYCGGIPSPNPDYPQTIHNVIGSNEFKIQNKNLLNSLTKTQGYPSNTAQAPSTTRLFTENTYVLGIATNNYYAPSTVSIEKCNEDEWEFKTIYSGYGISFPINFALNGSYRLSYEKKGNVNSALLKYDKTGNFIESVFNNVFEIDKNFNYLMLFYTFTTNETVGFSKAQIEQGTTATDFVEHKEQNLPFSLRSKNLFDINGNILSATSGYSIENNVLTVPSTSGGYGTIWFKQRYKSGEYSLSSKIVSGNSKRYIIKIFDNNDNVVTDLSIQGLTYNSFYNAYYTNSDLSFTIPVNYTFIIGFVYLGYSITDIQLEQGTATDYEPYYDIKAMEGTTLQDDGIHQKRKQIVLDGTQTIELANWRPSETSVGWVYPYSLTNNKMPTSTSEVPNVLCNKLIRKSYGDLYSGSNEGIGFIPNVYGLVVRIANPSLTTREDINVYLSENPLLVEYELETEEIIPYNETQQSQYNAIKKAQSYDDQTIITQKNEDLPFILNIEALKK